MTSSLDAIDAIKDRLNILDLISATGGAVLHKNGNGYEGHHTVHGSSSGASLKVDDKNNTYNCWNCGQRGDVFRWAGHHKYGAAYRNEGDMFTYALHECARVAGVKLEENEVDTEAAAERQRLEEIFQLVADFYHEELPTDQREWLHTRYGLTDDTIDKLKLGFAPAHSRVLFVTLRKQGIETVDLLKTGLFHQFDSGTIEDLFQGRIIFPYWRRGAPVYFIGRETDLSPQWEKEKAGMKYKKQMVHNEKHPYVSQQVRNDYFYGEDEARGTDTLFVTEGVTDCIIANQHGFPCISPVTVQFRNADHPKLIDLTKRATTIYIINDNEKNEAGRKGQLATAEALWKAGKIIRLIELPRPEGVDKVDLNDFLREQGPDALRAILPQGKTLLDIYIADVKRATAEEPKTQALRQTFGLIAQIEDEFILRQWRNSIPKQLGISKGDYDTYLGAAGETLEDEQHQSAAEPEKPSTWPYGVEDGCIVYYSIMQDKDSGETEIVSFPLCNFDARIVADVLHDDGEEVAMHMAIAGELQDGATLPEIDIKAEDFEKMQWVVAQWGARPAIVARENARGQLRHAVQVLSAGTLERRHVYTHTGWRVIDGKRVFLHAGGALGMDGIKVKLPNDLRNYVLPSDGAIDPVAAMRESINLLDIAPARIMYPLWAGIYLAPQASIIVPPFVISTEGQTGSKKSTLNTLLLNHFGSKFDEFHTPADWTGTGNSLERLAFHAKDIPFLIDDLKPSMNKYDNQKMMDAVQRIYRGVGNRHGKSRLTGDSEFQRTFEPRGVVMSTAERGVMGQSTAARGLTVYIEPGDIDLQQLTAAQRKRHVYGYAMTGFLQFMAENWDVLERDLPGQVLDERSGNGNSTMHGRLPHAMATMSVSFDLVMQYALGIGAIDQAEHDRRCAECRKVLLQIAAEQGDLVKQQDPALVYVQTLVTMLRQGKIKFVTKPTPSDAHEAGYGAPVGEYNGWHDDSYIYILPSAYNAVCKYVANEGWAFPSDETTLRRELDRAGYLETDANDPHNTVVRRNQQGQRKRVVAMVASKFFAAAAEMGIDSDDVRYSVHKQGQEKDCNPEDAPEDWRNK